MIGKYEAEHIRLIPPPGPDIIGEFETSQEDIDLDSWANRIKAEDSVATERK